MIQMKNLKNLFVLFFAASAILFSGCCPSVEDTVICVQLDPLQKVFKEELYFVETPDTAAVAKGETATFQFVLRSIYPIQDLKVEAGNLISGDRQITATEKAFVGYIRAGVHAGVHEGIHAAKSIDAVYPLSDLYPDCLQEVASINVASMSNQPVWIGYAIPRDAADGTYSATLVFTGKTNGKSFRITKQVNARVYPVTLPEQSLWITNWFKDDGFSKMNGNQPVERYSDRYWELLAAMARVMRDHGQNSYILLWDWVGLCKIENTDAQYSFDFTNFDRMVELLIREGGLKRIEGTHLGGYLGTGFGVHVPKMGKRPLDDELSKNFLSQFLPALYNHLENKGWTSMYVQHIADEPHDHTPHNALSYIRLAEMVKQHLPGIPLIDAVMTNKLDNILNIWVPVLDQYHRDYAFYQERQAAGDEVWFYTCTGPQGNYANRFLELPLIQTRFLHWINYRFGATGYLHWGFNFWHKNFTDDAGVNTWPGGDSWIVYPAEGKVYSSIRLKAMRDGIADYELLKLLEQKEPEKAKRLAAAVIKDFDRYNSNIRSFRLTRLELLKALSE